MGREAVLEQFKRLGDDFEEQKFSVENVVTRDDWVVLDYRWTVRGVGSGVQTQFDMAAAIRVQEGRLVEGHYRWNRAEALQAAGLEEAAEQPEEPRVRKSSG